MDTLIAAYQRLLAEVASDLHATRGVLTFSSGDDESTAFLTTGDTEPSDDHLTWLELPVEEDGVAVANLRLGFTAATPLPDPDEQRLAQALVELAVLLNR